MNPRRELYTLVGADLLSNLGTRVSVVAIPWLVLETTGSPTRMGLVAAAETLPYMLSSALATPWADRFGVRRTAVTVDAASAAAMAVVALAPWLGFGALLALVAVAGGLRGIGDRVKHVLFKPAAERAGVPLIRLTSAYDGLARGMTLFGAVLGGLLIDWVGVTRAIWIDAATFAACALLIGLLVRPPAPADPAPRESYLRALRGGFGYLRTDRTLLTMLVVVSASNMFANASVAVWIPLWVKPGARRPGGLRPGARGVLRRGAAGQPALHPGRDEVAPAGHVCARAGAQRHAPAVGAGPQRQPVRGARRHVRVRHRDRGGEPTARHGPVRAGAGVVADAGARHLRIGGVPRPAGGGADRRLVGGGARVCPALLVMAAACLVLTVGPLLLARAGADRPAAEPAVSTPA